MGYAPLAIQTIKLSHYRDRRRRPKLLGVALATAVRLRYCVWTASRDVTMTSRTMTSRRAVDEAPDVTIISNNG